MYLGTVCRDTYELFLASEALAAEVVMICDIVSNKFAILRVFNRIFCGKKPSPVQLEANREFFSTAVSRRYFSHIYLRQIASRLCCQFSTFMQFLNQLKFYLRIVVRYENILVHKTD